MRASATIKCIALKRIGYPLDFTSAGTVLLDSLVLVVAMIRDRKPQRVNQS
ncbi:MAG: hypothetical protein HXX11_14785 [Desulfuromonadales bacterium]|nr:hypothetical protein [Desulfuromonadales bacterium]